MALGLSALSVDSIAEEDMEMLRYIAAMLDAGPARRSRSCSSRACMGRRSPRSPTPRCG